MANNSAWLITKNKHDHNNNCAVYGLCGVRLQMVNTSDWWITKNKNNHNHQLCGLCGCRWWATFQGSRQFPGCANTFRVLFFCVPFFSLFFWQWGHPTVCGLRDAQTLSGYRFFWCLFKPFFFENSKLSCMHTPLCVCLCLCVSPPLCVFVSVCTSSSGCEKLSTKKKLIFFCTSSSGCEKLSTKEVFPDLTVSQV